jgi:hypothetical protein
MQRLLIALMAIGSLLMANPIALRAQNEGQAVDPAKGPHTIDEPVASPHGVASSQQHFSEQMQAQVPDTPEAVPSLPNNALPAAPSVHTVRAFHAIHGVRKQRSWCGSQLALLILGLLGAALAVIVTPNASRRVADHVSSNSRRDLQIGVLIGICVLPILFANAILLNIPVIKWLWSPIGLMVQFAPLLALGFGWVTAMRYVGDSVARKLNRSGDGSTFGRMALGLIAFFFANIILGSINRGLGVIGLCSEVAVALMGLGATVVISTGSGFGRRA